MLMLPLFSNLFFINRLCGFAGVYMNLILHGLNVFLLFFVYANSSVVTYTDLFSFVEVLNIFNSNYSIVVDGLALGLLIPVVIISCLVQLYSLYYMENDPSNQRFFFYLNFFSLFMTLLIIADNLQCLFLGIYSSQSKYFVLSGVSSNG